MREETLRTGPLVTKDRTPYRINCNSCRRRWFLTVVEYSTQLQDLKHDGFICPNCGSDDVNFDEENYKAIMGVERKTF